MFTPGDFQDLGSPTAVRLALMPGIRGRASSATWLAAFTIIPKTTRSSAFWPRPLTRWRGRCPCVTPFVCSHRGGMQPICLAFRTKCAMKVVFLTDGINRRVKIGKLQIILKRTTPRNMASAGKTSGLVIQALRHLGQRNIDDKIIQELKQRISAKDKKQLLADLRHAPVWAATVMRKIAESKKS